MSKDIKNISELVKDVRSQLGFSQEDLGRALGVSFVTVNRWENGKNVPSKLAQVSFDRFCEKMIKQGRLNNDIL